MMYRFTLSGIKAGITRLRNKGGASPDSLYDLVNAYVNASRDIVPRPGNTLVHTLPAGTVGMTVFNQKRHVFADHYVVMTNSLYVLHVIPAPDDKLNVTLSEIHFAEPMMGSLFVVAQYSDGSIYSFWLTEGEADPIKGRWTANTIYLLNAVAVPITPNGFYYRAGRLNPPEKPWAPDVERAVGNRVEPTVYNGYYFEVVEVVGTRPRSGTVEPVWSAIEDTLTVEDADNATVAPSAPVADPTLPPGSTTRYPPFRPNNFPPTQAP